MLKLTVDNKDFIDDIIITEDTILNIRLNNCNKDINIDVMDDMCLKVYEIDNNTSNKIIYNFYFRYHLLYIFSYSLTPDPIPT